MREFDQLKPELGHFPKSINTEKRALDFWIHLKPSPKEPMKRLINPVTSTNTKHTTQTSSALHLNINTKKVIKQSQAKYLQH